MFVEDKTLLGDTNLYDLEVEKFPFSLVHWKDPEGSGREGSERGDQSAEYM